MDDQLRSLERAFKTSPNGETALALLHAQRRSGGAVVPSSLLIDYAPLSAHSESLREELTRLANQVKLRISPQNMKKMGVHIKSIERATESNAATARVTVRDAYEVARNFKTFYYACDYHGHLQKGKGHRCGHFHATFANAQKCAKRMAQELLKTLIKTDPNKAFEFLS